MTSPDPQFDHAQLRLAAGGQIGFLTSTCFWLVCGELGDPQEQEALDRLHRAGMLHRPSYPDTTRTVTVTALGRTALENGATA